MDYRFTVLTFAEKITTKATGPEEAAPWSNLLGKTIPMPGVSVATVSIRDSDDRFDSGRYAPAETEQTMLTDFTFGSDGQPTAAGTPLSFHISSLIQSRTPNPDGSFDQFRAVFPRRLVSGAYGTELGGRYSVLLIALPRPDGSYPGFDPIATYQAVSVPTFGSNYPSIAYPQIACFTLGTLIETATGPRRVEALRRDDRIRTRDDGLQVLRWQGGAHVSRDGLAVRPNLRPILIRRGALGEGSPSRDMMVSPQHRVLVRSRIAHRLFDETEILVAAKHLVGLPGIEIAVPPAGVTYVHLLFDRHEIVMSDGAWTESLYGGPQAMASVGGAARREILSLFPELAAGTPPAPVRRLLNGREAQQLAQRQLRNLGRRRLVEAL